MCNIIYTQAYVISNVLKIHVFLTTCSDGLSSFNEMKLRFINDHFLRQDFLKFSKKAGIDSPELEVKTSSSEFFLSTPLSHPWVISLIHSIKSCILHPCFTESSRGHVCCAQTLQWYDERGTSPGLRCKTLTIWMSFSSGRFVKRYRSPDLLRCEIRRLICLGMFLLRCKE